jgi:hypothetical protein
MANIEQHPQPQPVFEVIDAPDLAARLKLPLSWIREQCRSRTSDKIPHSAFGRYKRFEWLSPDLIAWIARRRMKPGAQASHAPRRYRRKTKPRIEKLEPEAAVLNG